MAVILAAEDMLKAFEEKESIQGNNNNDRDFGRVLGRLETATRQVHRGIRYTDGNERDSSFDD